MRADRAVAAASRAPAAGPVAPHIHMTIPRNVEPLWKALRNEVIWLHVRWMMYEQLFGASPKSVDLLNRAASMAFYVISEALLRDVEMTLAKLAERKRGTATLKALRNKLEDEVDHKLMRELDRHLGDFTIACSRISEQRKKSHAHFDYETLTSPQTHPLPPLSRRQIKQALEALRRFMRFVEVGALRLDTETLYKVRSLNDGERLLEVLQRGVARDGEQG